MAATKSLMGAADQRSRIDQSLERQAEGDERSGNRGGARPAIGLNHIAIDPDGALAQLLQIGDRAQRSSDEPLNFLRPSTLLAPRRFASRAGQGRAGKHAILAGNPSLARVAQKHGNGFFHRGGADDASVPHLNQRRAFGSRDEVGNDVDRTKLVRRAVIAAKYHWGDFNSAGGGPLDSGILADFSSELSC